MSYDAWLEAPYMEEAEGCTCAGLSEAACPVHDSECFPDDEDETEAAVG